MPPAAITGTLTARTICGSSANVPMLSAEVIRQEMAAMTAGLQPLRDDRIGAVRFEPLRLLDRGRGGEDLRAVLARHAPANPPRAGRNESSRRPV